MVFAENVLRCMQTEALHEIPSIEAVDQLRQDGFERLKHAAQLPAVYTETT